MARERGPAGTRKEWEILMMMMMMSDMYGCAESTTHLK